MVVKQYGKTLERGWSGTKTAVEGKGLWGCGKNCSKHVKGIFTVDVSGLRERHQDIVVRGTCFGSETACEFAEDDAGADEAFGVVVVWGDPVWEVEKGEEFVLLFEESFTEAADIGIGGPEVNKPEELTLKTTGGVSEILARDFSIMEGVVMGSCLLEESAQPRGPGEYGIAFFGMG